MEVESMKAIWVFLLILVTSVVAISQSSVDSEVNDVLETKEDYLEMVNQDKLTKVEWVKQEAELSKSVSYSKVFRAIYHSDGFEEYSNEMNGKNLITN